MNLGLLKFIRCEMDRTEKDAFTLAQQAWLKTRDCKGFQGQIGGWMDNGTSAIALSFWRDSKSVQEFMENDHDRIFEASNQEATYTSCKVQYFDYAMTLPANDSVGFIQPFRSLFIRIAKYRLAPNGFEQFSNQQEQIWNPAMASAPGMQGGAVWRFQTADTDTMLVTSFWKDLQSHQAYQENQFVTAKQLASVTQPNAITELSSASFTVDKRWVVETLAQ